MSEKELAARLEAENQMLRETIKQLNETINKMVEKYILEKALPE